LEKNKAEEPIPFTKAIANMNYDYLSVKGSQANPNGKITEKSSPKQTSSNDSLDYYTADSNFDGDEEFENIEKSEAEMKEKKNEEDWVHVAKKVFILELRRNGYLTVDRVFEDFKLGVGPSFPSILCHVLFINYSLNLLKNLKYLKNNEEPSTSSYAVGMDEDSEDDMEDDFFKV